MIPSQPQPGFGRFVLGCAAIAAASVTVRAQSTTAEPALPDQAVQMSAFEVTTTQGTGYVATNAARAFKTSESLLDIPQVDLVITGDLIKDTGYLNSSDVLQYAGLAAVYEGEPVSIRGQRDNNPFIDDMPDSMAYEDDVYVDSYEVIKGPAAVLYPNAALSGIVIKSTKKALPIARDIITETVNEWGEARTTIDFNNPIGTFGDAKVYFRLEGAFMRGNQYWYNLQDDTTALHPNFTVVYHDAILHVAYDFQYLKHQTQNYSLMTPSGDLWTGWGRREDGFPPHDENAEYERRGTRIEYLQKISSTWENRFQAMEWEEQDQGVAVLPSGHVNWLNLSETYYSYTIVSPTTYWTLMDDVTGKNSFGPIKVQSTFGFNMSDAVSIGKQWTTNPTFGTADVVTVSLTSPASLNAVAVPSPQNFTIPANAGTRSKTLLDNLYFQEQVDVIPNWLSLVGGMTYSVIETINDTNISFNSPYASTDVPAFEWLHRFGAVLHITKDFVFYALTSTTFSPGSGPNYLNGRLPNIQGLGNEVGLKTAFLDGRISSSLSIYKDTLSNQSVIFTGGLNIIGATYLVPIGTTTGKGVDGDIAFSLVPGWQILATGYSGTVADQTGNIAINATFDNSWSFFTRYDFNNAAHKFEGWLKGLAFGGGVSRIGSYWQATGGFTVPPGFNLANPIKMHEGTLVNVFLNQAIGKHWNVRLNCVNLLNEAWVVGGQTPYKVDPSAPQTFAVSVAYEW